MPNDALVNSVRSSIIQAKKREGKAFLANMRAYRSTIQIPFQVVDKVVSGSNITMAHAICRPASWDFFGYAQGDSIPWGGTTRRANASDTNITKSKTTVGNEDLAIEGVSATLRGMRVQFNKLDNSANPWPDGISDPDVQRAYTGQISILDPMARMMPLQGQSPVMLEATFFEAIKPFCTLEFNWDNGKRNEKVAQLDQIPEGGAKSYLRANGDPRIDNRFRIPAGHRWMRQGTPADSEFVATLTLTDPLVIPINPVILAGTPTVPSAIYLDITLRLHAFAVSASSGN